MPPDMMGEHQPWDMSSQEPVSIPSHIGWMATEIQREEISEWSWGERLGSVSEGGSVRGPGQTIPSEMILQTLWSAVGSVLKMWIWETLCLAV